jgi:hypothetical protein
LNTILISTYTSSLWIFPSMNKTRLRLLTSSKQIFNLILEHYWISRVFDFSWLKHE